jgi:hypothetical protein
VRYNHPFVICFLATILFCIAAAFNITPYLRGPAPYPPEWQWAYFFVNTLNKIYLPILISILLIGLYIREENKNIFTKKNLKLFIFIVMLLFFFFQLSILFFSRSGIFVLIHRIINPELNGYFTASLTIKNVTDFLKNYNDIMLQFVYHAKSHPPGAILLFYVLKQLVAPFTFFIDFANNLTPAHSDVKQVWNTLLPIDKATALFSAFFIPFLSTVSLIPLYFSAKILYGSRVALRSIFLFFFIPTIIFFIPINDSLLHLFSITSFFFLLKGLQNNKLALFLSGATLFLGAFFNLSLLPVLILLFSFALFFLRQKKSVSLNDYITTGILFSLGFFLPPVLLNVIFHFNSLENIHMITTYNPGNLGRSYSLWLYYNIQDFLIFCGIPVTVIFLLALKHMFIQSIKKQFAKIDLLVMSFFLMLFILNFSGTIRGEAGRIWLPYVPFMVLTTVNYMTKNLKFSGKLFAGILLLQVIQILVMQEFWVMLW